MHKRSYWSVVVELWAWARGQRRRFVVGGESMLPTLEAGWFVLVDPLAEVREGQIVVARHPEHETTIIIKRVAGILPGQLVMRSDNASVGSDSRHFGPVKASEVIGVATLILDQPRRLLGLHNSVDGAHGRPG